MRPLLTGAVKAVSQLAFNKNSFLPAWASVGVGVDERENGDPRYNTCEAVQYKVSALKPSSRLSAVISVYVK